MTKLTLTRVTRLSNDKEGNPLSFKDKKTGEDKTYTKVLVNANEYGEKCLSAFGADWNADWAEGMTIDATVEEKEWNGTVYLNLKAVNKTSVLEDKLNDLEKRVAKLESVPKPTSMMPTGGTNELEKALEEPKVDDIPF